MIISKNTTSIEGIVLRNSASSDYNTVFTLLTSNDIKISLFASNIKRTSKKQAMPEILDICKFELVESSDKLNRLKDYKFIHSFNKLRENFTKLCASTLLIEAIDKLIKEDDINKNIYNLTKDALILINKENEDLKIFKILYDTLFALLVFLGFEHEKLKKPASKNHLITLINNIEGIIEMELKSKSSLLLILPKATLSKASQNHKNSL